MHRFMDTFLFLYFAVHIVITVCFDSQIVFPSWIYPNKLIELKEMYCERFYDTMMLAPPKWYLSFCLCEMFLQFPFCFVGAYVYWKGVSNFPWFKGPALVYSTHVATSLVAILYFILTHDFRGMKPPGPSTMEDRLWLASVYAPYLFIPLLMMFDALLSDAYTDKVKLKEQ